MTTSNIPRLRALVEAGFASAEEIALLQQLETPKPTQRSDGMTNTNNQGRQEQPTSEDPDDEVFIPLNTESFERGGGGFLAPPKEGIFPGRCTGTMVPTNSPDQLWFLFAGSNPDFHGALVTTALTMPSVSSGHYGAFKVKDILIALDVPYTVHPGSGVAFRRSNLTNAKCQVEWSYIEYKGKRELRIQNVYPMTQKIESL